MTFLRNVYNFDASMLLVYVTRIVLHVACIDKIVHRILAITQTSLAKVTVDPEVLKYNHIIRPIVRNYRALLK